MTNLDPRIEKVLYSHEQIVNVTKEIAEWINDKYKNSKELILVGLLKGCIPFMAELIKHIKVDHKMDFMTISSYEGGLAQKKNIKIVMDLNNDISGKDIIIVEDIVDSGKTLSKVLNYMKNMNPKSLEIVALLDKKCARKVEINIAKSGFIVDDVFVAGFGLDVKEKLRNLPYIGIFKKSEFDKL